MSESGVFYRYLEDDYKPVDVLFGAVLKLRRQISEVLKNNKYTYTFEYNDTKNEMLDAFKKRYRVYAVAEVKNKSELVSIEICLNGNVIEFEIKPFDRRDGSILFTYYIDIKTGEVEKYICSVERKDLPERIEWTEDVERVLKVLCETYKKNR